MQIKKDAIMVRLVARHQKVWQLMHTRKYGV